MSLLHQHKASFAVETFFPFDPYRLPKSGRFIRPLYQEWEGAKNSDLISQGDSETEHDTDDEYLQNHRISESDRDKMSGIILDSGST
jgi:RNA polymerase I-specific transcription initiation factor RRN3